MRNTGKKDDIKQISHVDLLIYINTGEGRNKKKKNTLLFDIWITFASV